MEVRVSGIGKITLKELEARFLAYMNAGATEPVPEGTRQERNNLRTHSEER
jgi:hypothetical protein